MKEMQIKVQTFVGLYTIYSIKPDPDSKSFGKTEFPEILLVYNDNGATFPTMRVPPRSYDDPKRNAD